jgi:hypothetical protein
MAQTQEKTPCIEIVLKDMNMLERHYINYFKYSQLKKIRLKK